MINFPIDSIRKDFPILGKKINNNDLVYFDNAATTQKPNAVINAISDYYKNYNANIHRGVHSLAEKATTEFENTRKSVKEFINAKSEREIIFTRGATEGINLVSTSFGKEYFNEGDEIIISAVSYTHLTLPTIYSV